MKDRNLQAPWVGKTPEEYRGQRASDNGGVVECENCQYMYDCERTYLGSCTDGKAWEE